jgi:uncharacterized protein (DUF302 family)
MEGPLMKKTCLYGFGKTIDLDYEAAVTKVVSDFEKRGFRILSNVDIRNFLQNDLGLPFRRYTMLAILTSQMAYRALSAEIDMGLLLPCHIVIYEENDGGTTVMAMDPARYMDLVRAPAGIEVAIELKDELESLFESL